MLGSSLQLREFFWIAVQSPKIYWVNGIKLACHPEVSGLLTVGNSVPFKIFYLKFGGIISVKINGSGGNGLELDRF